MTRLAGFTLWELLCALAVAGVGLTLGAPALHGLVDDARRTSEVNAFVAAVQLARSEAAKRGRPVVLCKTRDQVTCGDAGMSFAQGWMVFVNENAAQPPHRAPAEPLLRVRQPRAGTSTTANRQMFEFRPLGLRSTNGTVVFCSRRGTARAVIVSYTGRPRVSAEAAGGGPLPCSDHAG